MYPQKECNNICITHALYTYNADMYDVYTKLHLAASKHHPSLVILTANLRCEAAKRKQKMLGQYVQSVYSNTYFKKQISVYQQIVRYSQYINKYQQNRNLRCIKSLGMSYSSKQTYQQNILRLVESPSPRRLSNCDAVYSIRTPMISCDGTIQVLRSNQNGEHVGFNMI